MGIVLKDIRCEQFIWENNEASCLKGRAAIQSPYWQAVTANFSFHYGKNKSTVSVNSLNLGGSHLSFSGSMTASDWQFRLKGGPLSHLEIEKLVNAFLPGTNMPAPKQGAVNLDMVVSGQDKAPVSAEVSATISNLSMQTSDGKLASENLTVSSHFSGRKVSENWQWRNETRFLQGGLYADPVYWEAGKSPITFQSQGRWNPETAKVRADSFEIIHPGVGSLSGSAAFRWVNKLEVEQAQWALHSNNGQELFATYVKPFLTGSAFEGLTVSGEIDAQLSAAGNKIKTAKIQFNRLNGKDDANRSGFTDASGIINWSDDEGKTEQSLIQWRHLQLKGLPFEAAHVAVESRGKRFKLPKQLRLPVLDGAIVIDKFRWRSREGDEPDIIFAGSVAHLSLEKLSKALNWTPLTGQISGQIPGIRYRKKTLSLDGELLINVFDGLVRVKNLSSSGLFSDFPKINSDISIENLDLDQLTRKFEFGAITGKLTGFVNSLALEKWRPVSFLAWFGTPDDDGSPHTISQKAVNNIASIGGGGATDLISRSLLRFFDTFRYDKIGVGCYLHNGVCQMSGVEAAEQGYYLIKGGCLPRIDVLGYNTQVNWDVLVERLARVARPEQAVIQ